MLSIIQKISFSFKISACGLLSLIEKQAVFLSRTDSFFYKNKTGKPLFINQVITRTASKYVDLLAAL